MANSDARRGLIPRKHSNGAPYNGSARAYYVPSSYATALYVGDPVVRVAGGSNTSAFRGHKAGTLPQINKATAGGSNYVTGSIVGFDLDPSNLDKSYNPASNERIVYVADDPDLIFEIQEDSDGGALGAADVGLNANLIFTHSGSTATGYSGAELDSSSAATTATLQLKIVELIDRADNEVGTNAKVGVTINLHTQRYATGI
jgi:hypothetical protein